METQIPPPRRQEETFLVRYLRTRRSLTNCWGKSVRSSANQPGDHTYLQLRDSAQPLQAQLQAVLPALTTAFQQPGNNQPQQQQPSASVSLNVNNAPPVPPSNTQQQPTVATALTLNIPNQNPPQQKASVNQNVNGGTGSGLPPPLNAQGAAQGTNNATVPTQLPNAITSSTCRLTGCTKPVYTDPTFNHASEYCSKRHRE
jgi:hypothetical protein